MVARARDWSRRRLDPAERYGLRLTAWTFVFVMLAIPFGLLLWQVVSRGPLTDIDQSVARTLRDHVDPGADVAVLRVVTTFGDPWVLTPAVVLGGIVLARWQRWRLLTFLVTTTVVGGLVNASVKVVVGRDRPVLEDPIARAGGKSFTSGHAMTSLVCYGALLLVFLPAVPPRLRRWIAAVYVVLVGAIGFSRLALGVHFLSDVIGGWALGLAWLAGCTAAFSLWREDLRTW